MLVCSPFTLMGSLYLTASEDKTLAGVREV